MLKSSRSFNRLGTILYRGYSDNYGILPDSARVVIGGKIITINGDPWIKRFCQYLSIIVFNHRLRCCS